MKTVSDHFAAPIFSAGSASDSQINGSLLGRIGEDLRHHLDDAIDSEVPRSLLELAEAIDARRIGEPRED